MQTILTLNSGSSSIKFSVFSLEASGITKKYSGTVVNIKQKPNLKIKSAAGDVLVNQNINPNPNIKDIYEDVIHQILEWLKTQNITIIGAGHRVAHGGIMYRKATIINPTVISNLEKLIPLAPLHQPYNTNGAKILAKEFPEIPQVVCFDTAFHTTCNHLSQLFAIPKYLTDEGVIRYGFHGLSYKYVVSQFDKYLPKDKVNKKIIIAHLGQGATMCAIENKQSVATSIGFSALDGLPMGTRTGTIDAGVILYLSAEKKMSYKEIEELLYKKSGLLGVSGISSDMKELEESNDPNAKLAIDLFVYRINGWIGSLAAELGGLDGIIFTAGIGENSPLIRAKVCEKASWLGVKIDSELNNKNSHTISTHDSKIFVGVIPTDEETVIAMETFNLLAYVIF